MTYTIYTFENTEGEEEGCYQTENIREAEEYARANCLAVIVNEFEWTDSWPVDDMDFRNTSP